MSDQETCAVKFYEPLLGEVVAVLFYLPETHRKKLQETPNGSFWVHIDKETESLKISLHAPEGDVEFVTVEAADAPLTWDKGICVPAPLFDLGGWFKFVSEPDA
jgi:hypothetical protein